MDLDGTATFYTWSRKIRSRPLSHQKPWFWRESSSKVKVLR